MLIQPGINRQITLAQNIIKKWKKLHYDTKVVPDTDTQFHFYVTRQATECGGTLKRDHWIFHQTFTGGQVLVSWNKNRRW